MNGQEVHVVLCDALLYGVLYLHEFHNDQK